MKQPLLLLLSFIFLTSFSHRKETQLFHDGDIIFQTSSGDLSKAIQLATKSNLSHCGIIFFDNGKPYVYEAIQPVCKTPVEEWISRGTNKKYYIKSLKDKKRLDAAGIKAMKQNCNKFLGKNYDIYFGWSDERIYCSELVWKIYKYALNIEPGKLQHLREFDLSSDIVKQKLKERYGNDIPYDEQVISPQAIFESSLLR